MQVCSVRSSDTSAAGPSAKSTRAKSLIFKFKVGLVINRVF
jgi:hypothetical protein